MSTHKISDLPLAGPITGDEQLEIVQGGQNKRVTADQLGGGGSSGGIPDAPDDGKLYGRKGESWQRVGMADVVGLSDALGDVASALDAISGEAI